MGLHSPTAAKRLWNLLRVAFFMMRKGLISKRKLLMDMNFMMKRSSKLTGKNLRSLIFHHHRPSPGYGLTLKEYEFSCSNSPNPIFFHSKKRHHNYFPCLNAIVKDPDETPRIASSVPRIEYSPSPSPSPQCLGLLQEVAVGEAKSPFSVRICDYSDEEEDGGETSGGAREVDLEAEEFIRAFYERLRAQGRVALIEYQEREVQEMLARGC